MFDARQGWNISFKPLWWGFITSALLLIGMYWMTSDISFPRNSLIGVLLAFTCISAMLQFVLFMHIGIEEKPRWGLMVLLLMLLIMFILVGGSLWIMTNINYNAM